MISHRLDPEERNLLGDAAIFRTKAAIDAKISDLFFALKKEILSVQAKAGHFLPAEFRKHEGRIYRGEQLDQLPWRALDCPNLIKGTDIFVYRTLIVWGRDISLHAILAGHWLDTFRGPLIASLPQLAHQGWTVCASSTPWDWNRSNHKPILPTDLGRVEASLAEMNWVKFSKWLSLESFDDLDRLGSENYQNLLSALSQ